MAAVPALDLVIHPPNHLRLCAMLAAVFEAEFATLRNALGVSDPSLSKYLRILQDAGYVTLTKPPRPGRRRTWVQLTSDGRTALWRHLTALRQLAEPVLLADSRTAVDGDARTAPPSEPAGP